MQQVAVQDSLAHVLAGLKEFGNGLSIYLVGPEGAGKTSLLDRIRQALGENLGTIPFSEVLIAFLPTMADDPNLAEFVSVTDAAIKRRDKKSIPLKVVTTALEGAMHRCHSENKTDTITDGFPRTAPQGEEIPNIVDAFSPQSIIIILEARCTRPVAFRRAIKRGKSTDTPQLIGECHDEYYGQLRDMRALFAHIGHHVVVSTSEDGCKLSALTEAFTVLLEEFRSGMPAIVPAQMKRRV
jgi:adenylate kinase family enzyme